MILPLSKACCAITRSYCELWKGSGFVPPKLVNVTSGHLGSEVLMLKNAAVAFHVSTE